VGVGVGVGRGVALGLAVGVGVGVGLVDPGREVPGKRTLTSASVDVNEFVVMVTPDSGSVKDRPTVSAESSKVLVDGVMSSSCDWVRTDLSGATRTRTPLVADDVDVKVS
jgi:hypothetical protein